MTKKICFCLLMLLFLCGCSKKEEVIETKPTDEKEEVIEVTPTYQDHNQTPISFYQLKGNQLVKISSITGNYNGLDDVGLFQIYPSNEDVVSLNSTFASSFYQTWSSYNPLGTLKIGFSLEVPIEGKETITYNIFNPNQTMDHWEYFMAYLYDDYANQGKSFYSHIEPNEYTDTTLFTAFKLQCGAYSYDISSKVLLTVFTYDGEDDFLDGKYRGNSSYTLPICIHGAC